LAYFFLAAFSAALVTREVKNNEKWKWDRAGHCVGTFATLALGLLHRLDNADGNSLSHVTDGETTKGRIFIVALNAHGLRRSELDDGGITGLDELGVRLHYLTRSAIDLLNQLAELAGNVCSVAIKHWCVTGTDLTRVVEYDDLCIERRGFLGGVVLGVGAHVPTSDILDGNVPVHDNNN
jgi:hypothetical protein